MNENEKLEQEMVANFTGEIRKNSGWVIFMGILLAALGMLGLYMAGLTTLVSIFYIGIMLLAGGLLMLFDTFKAEGWKARLWDVLMSLAYLAAGVLMIMNPGAGAAWFTVFIAAFLLVSGVSRIIIGLQVRSEVPSWGWTVFSGLISLVLALMIFSSWPESSIWVIGMFVAIEMLMQGLSMIFIGTAARSLTKAA